ncbi:MAG: methyltransferase domain-containing protein [Coriobacteriia bacterium]
MADWNPDSYLRFEDHRTRPAFELVSHVRVDSPKTVIDLGCGPGNSTQVIRERWPGAMVLGLDSSPGMISAARESYPDHEWALGDIGAWSSEQTFDVVFSNAALQWVPDHARLIPRLFRQVAQGGALAFQIPSRIYCLAQQLIEEVADDEAWASRMQEARSAITIADPDVYYDLLAPLARAVDMWETVYYQVMDSPQAIVDWISSTGLRPYLDALDSEDERQHFVSLLTERVARSYRLASDGKVLFPFRRTSVIAYA